MRAARESASAAAAASTLMPLAARLGLLARALLYLLLGLLAITVGLRGSPGAEVDQRGVLDEVIERPFGGALVWVLALGFAGYGLWRLSQAITGNIPGEPPGAMARLTSLVRGIAYLLLFAIAVSVVQGVRADQSEQQSDLAGSLIATGWGHWLLAGFGLVVAAVGATMVADGWRGRFLRTMGAVPAGARRTVTALGRVGTIARGVVFALVGLLVVVAAWQADPEQAGGIDQAVDLVLSAPAGPPIVIALGLGLVAFGAYGLCEARWARVPEEQPHARA